MKSYLVPEGYCLCCNKKLDAAGISHGNGPRPKDITICVYCGMIMQFGPDLRLLKVDDAEIKKVRKSAAWKDVVEIQKKLNTFWNDR